MAKLKSSLAADLRPHSDMSKSIAKTQSISCCIFASEAMRPILQLRLMQPVLMSLKMCFNIVKKMELQNGIDNDAPDLKRYFLFQRCGEASL